MANKPGAIRSVLRFIHRLNPDLVIGLCLFLAGLYAYTTTLAPTVLDGDAALFQYTPYILGVTYPTGYPLYILLGKLWVTLFPFGEIAWRMNLLSALCSAAALPLIYGAARRLFTIPPSLEAGRLAALTTALTFATLPTFWRWSTETKIYTLNILLFSGVLYTLAYTASRRSASPGRLHPLMIPGLLLGLQLTVHSTTVLLIPGLWLFVWLHLRQHLQPKKSLITNLLALMLPGLLYLYIPLRAEWLIAQYGYSEAIRRGLLADFYHSGLAGLVRYFTAADFTGGMVTNWGLVPQQFFAVYGQELLTNDITRLGIGLGIAGGLGLAFGRPRLFWPLGLLYALPIPFVLTYGQGEQSAFLLPSFLIFSMFIGNIFNLVELVRLRSHVWLKQHHFILHPLSFILQPLSFLLLLIFLWLPQTQYNLNWLRAKWDRAIYDEWADALAHPLEPGAALLAHWGDLTSFWYMQYAEGRRPDLRGLYPPTEAVVQEYLKQGGALYIAGPLQGWANGIQDRYQLLPWGRLVRLAPKSANPETLLPKLPHQSNAIFDNKLRLMGHAFMAQAIDGQPFGATLAWQTLAELPPETTISLRLSQGDIIAAQLDDTLLSGWFPQNNLLSGQNLLSYVPIPVPPGTLPGKYRLQLVVYLSYKHPWPLADGATLLDLGEVDIIIPPAGTTSTFTPLNPLTGFDFNAEITLADYEYTANRVGQGKGFGLKLLWQALAKPEDNYLLLAELVDRNGQVLRSVQQPPVGGRAPTAGWQPGQFIRDQIDFVLPASAPVGDQAVQVRLSWLRPNGSKLQVRRWYLPAGETLNLAGLAITEKEGRVFTVPPVQQPVEANFDHKVRLLGYNTQPELTWSQSRCAASVDACMLHFDLIWQAIREMDELYFAFFHVVDKEGKIVAQQDKGPGKRGKEPTTSWLPGEVITDPVDVTLSADLPPGQYTLQVGLYLPPLGPPLPVVDQTGTGIADFVELGVLEVTP